MHINYSVRNNKKIYLWFNLILKWRNIIKNFEFNKITITFEDSIKILKLFLW